MKAREIIMQAMGDPPPLPGFIYSEMVPFHLYVSLTPFVSYRVRAHKDVLARGALRVGFSWRRHGFSMLQILHLHWCLSQRLLSVCEGHVVCALAVVCVATGSRMCVRNNPHEEPTQVNCYMPAAIVYNISRLLHASTNRHLKPATPGSQSATACI